MPVSVTATLRTAVRELEAEKARIDHQLGALQNLLVSLNSATRRTVRARRQGRIQPRRRRLSARARRALSQRTKAWWAKRRAPTAKGQAKIAARK